MTLDRREMAFCTFFVGLIACAIACGGSSSPSAPSAKSSSIENETNNVVPKSEAPKRSIDRVGPSDPKPEPSEYGRATIDGGGEVSNISLWVNAERNEMRDGVLVVGRVPSGQTVLLLECRSDLDPVMYRVKWGRLDGWVSQLFLPDVKPFK